jgi:hypothetical protein
MIRPPEMSTFRCEKAASARVGPMKTPDDGIKK